MDEQTKIVVLLSGGIDSATLLGLAVKDFGAENVIALSIYYGQKHEKELDCAKALTRHYGVEHYAKDLSAVFTSSDCTLLQHNRAEVPQGTYAEQQQGVAEPVSTYVPFRNGLFISCAASIALGLGATMVAFGAHKDDACGQAYPDCSEDFFHAIDSAVSIGSGNQIFVAAPFIDCTKSEIVAEGLKLGVPYELTWSCYEGGKTPCGKCGTCIDRAKAFESNGVSDPAISKI